MSKIMQNLIVLMEPSEKAFLASLKAGNMIFNRFCIDEDAAFELSGVYYLKKHERTTRPKTRRLTLLTTGPSGSQKKERSNPNNVFILTVFFSLF